MLRNYVNTIGRLVAILKSRSFTLNHGAWSNALNMLQSISRRTQNVMYTNGVFRNVHVRYLVKFGKTG